MIKAVTISILLIIYAIPNSVYAQSVNISDADELPIITTRGNYDGDGDLKSGKSAEDYDIIGKIPGLDVACPEEIVIYIHGVWNSESVAKDNFNQFNKVLKSKGYNHQVIGYSWDSDTDHDDASAGFNDARKAAISNGKALAKFILDYNAKCNNTKIRIVSHSLGAAVVLSAIAELDNKNKKEVIESVDMFGPAVDNEEIQKGTTFASSNNIGKAIENVVKSMYVYWSSEDDVFSSVYWAARKDQALGENSIEDYSKKPTNVTIINALNELSADTDGDGKPDEHTGDNHSGYSGVVSKGEIITDDGAIDIAYDHWLSKSGKSYIKVMWSMLRYKGDDIGNDAWYFYFTVNNQKTDWYSKNNQINNGEAYFSNGTEITSEKPIPQTGKIIYIQECEVGKEIKLDIDITAYLDETWPAEDDKGSASKTINLFCKQDNTRGNLIMVNVTEPGGLFSDDKTAEMWFTLKIETTGKPAYNLTLLEDGKPSDGTINLGDNITAKASTNDENVKNVKFRWLDPSMLEVSSNIKPINNEDEYTPNKPGRWTIIAEFDDGNEVIKSIDVPFMVLNESIIGAIALVGASIITFIAYNKRFR